MQNGVSLVVDLFSLDLSKADWRRIVMESVRLMLHRNAPHGLRHVFIEEAAEFVPQKVIDGQVYAEVEKLARMGGNARLAVRRSRHTSLRPFGRQSRSRCRAHRAGHLWGRR